MEMDVNVAGVWHKVVTPSVNVAGVWHSVQSGWVNVAGVWKPFYAAFVGPVVHTYNTNGAYTDTIPFGSVNVVIECWGPGGGGSHGVGTGCSAQPGCGGASGGYSRSSYSVVGHGLQTLSLTVGTGGIAGGFSGGTGTASKVVSGSFALTTMTGNSGTGGNLTIPAGGVGGTAAGGTQANTPGNAGGTEFEGTAGPGVVGIHGTGPIGGRSGFNVASPGLPGGDGLIILYYT